MHCLPLLQVLSGCVSSCEDHGYVIDIGVKGISAFLNSTEAEKYTSAYGEGLSDHALQFVVVTERSYFCHNLISQSHF